MQIENNIQDFIGKTRIKPALFIGEKSITKYSAFMDGWIFDKRSDIADINLLREFQDWIQQRFDIRTTHHWSQIILFFSLNEQEAFDKFLSLWDQFLVEKNN
ncbi:MAG: hypothetical protein JJ966_12660 [Balneolaceae bacterium]|nr:hypothetical protein [Balneolaceae bacterium]